MINVLEIVGFNYNVCVRYIICINPNRQVGCGLFPCEREGLVCPPKLFFDSGI